MTVTRAGACLVVLLLQAVDSLVRAHSQAPATAQQILHNVSEVYATCRSYRDSGVADQGTGQKMFTTAFVRPDRFRFEYRETAPDGRERRYIIWRKAAAVQTWWDVTGRIERPSSLGLAIAAATGVSSATAHTIPALLLREEIGGRPVTALEGPIRLDDEALNGTMCFRVQGKSGDRPIVVWIDQKSWLVLRIDHKFANLRTSRITTYQPAVNGIISNDMLEPNWPSPR